VLVVDDEPMLRNLLSRLLRMEGYDVIEAADGEAALDLVQQRRPDLVLLDVMLPGLNGFEICEELRRHDADLPILMVTAKGEEQDRVRGLKEGADDYVVKPFSATELLARVEAVLRRSAERPRSAGKVTVAGRCIDLERREVVLPTGEREVLSQKEADVVGYLMANRGRAIAREELLSRVWGLDPRGVHTRTVDMTIARLRELLRDDPANPAVIVTVRAKGYMLAGEDKMANGK